MNDFNKFNPSMQTCFTTVATARVFSFGTARTETVPKDHFKRYKFSAKDNKVIHVDRTIPLQSSKPETPSFPAISARNSNRHLRLLEKIKFENDRRNDIKEKYSNIKRDLNTKILGGGPLHPVPMDDEKHIIDIDPTV